jgi:hypothetical protein
MYSILLVIYRKLYIDSRAVDVSSVPNHFSFSPSNQNTSSRSCKEALSAHATLRQPTSAHRPPRHGLAAAGRIRLKALLHRVGERPPAARLRIRGDGGHVGGVVRAGLHKVRDEERERRVVVDRVLRDVVRGERSEHAGPARARRVQRLVLSDGRGLELCAGPRQRLGMRYRRRQGRTLMIWQTRLGSGLLSGALSTTFTTGMAATAVRE